ncbi:MAG: alpha/beta hydrolase family protein [Spirochaetaceae bacterium]
MGIYRLELRVSRLRAAIGGCVVACVVAGVAVPASARPGQILEAEFDRTYSASDMDREAAGLFEDSQAEAPSARYAVDVYLIDYQSTYPDGVEATIRAQLFVPRMPSGESRPLYVFAPGSTGLIDACRPSREHVADIHWGLYRAHALTVSAQGMVGLVPDYMGFGDPDRLQPFFNADAEAHMMLDGVRATDAFLRSESEPAPEEVFLAGYSQGGHAAFAAADYRRRYASEVEITGIVGYGPTTDMYALLEEFAVVGPLVAYTFRERYGVEQFDPSRMLQERWLSSLDEDVTGKCIGAIQEYYPWDPRSLYREDFAEALTSGRVDRDFPAIDVVLREHTVGLSEHGIPALILQGTDDIVVYPSTQREFVERLRAAGSEVTYNVYENERHDVRQAAFGDVLEWMKERS